MYQSIHKTVIETGVTNEGIINYNVIKTEKNTCIWYFKYAEVEIVSLHQLK